MGAIFLQGWDSTPGAEKWVKLICDNTGRLIIDPTAILENPPTEDEAKKAATSEWAYDHWKDAAAHHAKYTDADSRAAIGGLFNGLGEMLINLNGLFRQIVNISQLTLKATYGSAFYTFISAFPTAPELQIGMYQGGVGYVAGTIKIYNGTAFETVIVDTVMDAAILTHKNISAAHHARYTNAEAVAACNLDGNLYWSCPGIHFDGSDPSLDDITKSTNGSIIANADGVVFVAAVDLPDGATVTGAIVYGNAGIQDVPWILRRVKHTDLTAVNMASADIGSEDTSITSPVIDNSLYSYILITSNTVTNDIIYGARITYTL